MTVQEQSDCNTLTSIVCLPGVSLVSLGTLVALFTKLSVTHTHMHAHMRWMEVAYNLGRSHRGPNIMLASEIQQASHT